MIEVLARLEGGPAYFAGGEKISCVVTFQKVARPDPQQNSANSRDVVNPEILGWASAQIVCICSINPRIVNAQKVKDTATPNNLRAPSTIPNTSLSPSRGEHGCVIFSTKPKILVCDLALFEDLKKDFFYEETLPSDLPPSFRGQAVKYSYKLKIGLQRLGAPVKMLHVPLRVMTWQSLGLSDCHDEEEIAVTNPFLKRNPKDSLFDQALEAMQLLSSRRSPNVYKVTNSHGKVVSLCLFKSNYRLGEDIVGTLDFSDAVVSCMQYSVTLQSQEIVPEDKRRRIGNQSTGSEEAMVTSHSKHHEFSVGFLQTHLSLPVPLHVTPSFDTDTVILKWRLHFEFVTAIKPVNWNADAEWQPPRVVDIETMVWDFPVVIYPTTPAHVSKALYGQREARLTL